MGCEMLHVQNMSIFLFHVDRFCKLVIKTKNRRWFSDLQLPSFGDLVPAVDTACCSWLTGVEPDILLL